MRNHRNARLDMKRVAYGSGFWGKCERERHKLGVMGMNCQRCMGGMAWMCRVKTEKDRRNSGSKKDER